MDRWQSAPARIVWPVRVASVAVLVAWFAIIVANIGPFREFDLRFWFFYDDSYADLGERAWWAGGLRLGLILLAVTLTAAFLALVPRRHTIFSAFGQATMYVYLLHSFVLYPIRESGILKDEHASATWLLTMVFASIAIAIVLSSPWVRRVFRPLVEPKPNWPFLADDHRTRGESRTDPTGARRR